MYYNEARLIEYADELRRNFTILSSAMQEIESNFDECTKMANWDSITRDFFLEKLNDLKLEFDKVNNKLLNINNYLDSVITNYQQLDNSINNAINDAFSGF